MTQFSIQNGSREVVVTSNGTPGSFWHARLYVDNGNLATLTAWKGKSEAGARRWAAKVLGR
jgi:hypothetical protein